MQNGATAAETTSAADGTYSFESVKPGRYHVEAQSIGFAPFIGNDAYVSGTGATTIDVSLQTSPLKQEVVVSATGSVTPISQVGSSVALVGSDDIQAENKLDVLENLRDVSGAQIVQTSQRFVRASQETALRTVSAWTGLPASEASFEGSITKDDQWTVYSSVRPYGPFWKYSWPNGEEVYVSQTTGEVVQDTTRASRTGAYFGAIPHWLYFIWLCSNGSLWTQVVIWLSGVGTVVSILGLVAGIWLYSPSKRYKFRTGSSSVPFTGQKRWHVILGLVFGVVTCTWVFSGLMSMGPFAWVSDPVRPNLDRSLRGNRVDLSLFDAKSPAAALIEAASVLKAKEVELILFAREPFYLATDAASDSVLVPMQSSYKRAFNRDQVRDTVSRIVAPASIVESRWVTNYEPYYVDRQNKKPLPVVYIELNDVSRSSFYIDPRTGRVVQSYGVRSRWNRWLYHGLHSIDLPALYAHRPAWDIVVLTLMAGGTALSITSLVIAWKRLRAKLFGKSHSRSGEVVGEGIPDQEGAVL